MNNSKKESYIHALIDSGAFLVRSVDEEPFTLRSGKESCMFLNHSLVALRPEHYRAYINAVAQLLADRYQSTPYTLCNVDSKISAQIVGSLAYTLSLPQIIFRSAELAKIEKGPNQQLTGDPELDTAVAIIDDVITGGDGTAKNVGDLVSQTFAQVGQIEIFVGFIREPKESTYTTHYAITRNELIDRVWPTLTKGQQEAVNKELSQTI